MVRADERGLVAMLRKGRGGMALSVVLHLAAATALLSIPALPRPDDQAPPVIVELAVEQAVPPAAAPAPPPPAPMPPAVAASRPIPSPRQIARAVPPRPAVAPPAPVAAPAPEPSAPASPALPAAEPPPAPTAPPPAADPAPYGDYVGRMHDRIAQRRIYPPQSIRRREEGDVRLRVLVATDGRLLHIQNLEEASVLLTKAARNAVENSAPFDPPPPGTASDTQIAFDVTVVFRLH